MSGTFFGLLVAAIVISVSTETLKKKVEKERKQQELKSKLNVKVEITPTKELKKVEKPTQIKKND